MRSNIYMLIKGLLTIVFLFAWLNAKAETNNLENPGFIDKPNWFKTSFLDLREDIAEAAQRRRRLLIFFYQDGCPYCEKLIKVNFTQKTIVDETRQNFDVIAINMWGDREVTDTDGKELTEKDFAQKRRVMFTPTLLFLDEHGKQALRINGYFPPEKFRVALDYVAGKYESKMRFSDYLHQKSPEPSSGKLNNFPLMSRAPDALVKRHKAFMAVFFEQKQCPACDEMHRDVLKRPETMALLKKFDVVQYDMWSREKIKTPQGRLQTVAQWAHTNNIKYTPTIVLFDSQGNEVMRMEAYLKSFHVQSVLDYVSSRAYLKEPSLQRYIEKRADAIRKTGKQIHVME